MKVMESENIVFSLKMIHENHDEWINTYCYTNESLKINNEDNQAIISAIRR